MAASKAPGANEPVGIINRVDGEVWIERGSERIPVIGSERLHPGDRLVSVGDGSAEVRFNTLDARGKPLLASVPVGGNVVVPSVEGLKGNALAAEIEKSGLSLDDLPIEDLFNPLQAGASRMLAGVLGLDAGVAAAAAAAGFKAAAASTPLDSTEVPVSDNPIPGLNLTQAQADAVGEPVSDSPVLGAASLAALQSVAGAGMPSDPSSARVGASEASAVGLPLAGERVAAQSAEPFRPDVAATSALAAGSIAAQASSLERVGDVASAAPAMLGKEETAEQLQSELNSALADVSAIEDVEAAALLADVAEMAALPLPDALTGLIPGGLAESVGLPVNPASPAAAGISGEDNAFNRLLKMIEAFEAKINDLTGLVYSSFEGVGPDILNAKSEFSALPTSELLSGLSDAVNVVTRDVSSLDAGNSGETLGSVASTLVSGLDDPLSAAVDGLESAVVGLADVAGSSAGALQQTFSDLSGSLSNVLNTVGDIAGVNVGNLGGGVSSLVSDLGGDIGAALNLVNTTSGGSAPSVTGAVTHLIDNLTGGGSSGGSGAGGLLGGGSLLDGLTGGGGLLNQASAPSTDSGESGGLPGIGSAGSDSSGAGLPSAPSGGGGGDDLMSSTGTSSGMSSSAGGAPIDPNNTAGSV